MCLEKKKVSRQSKINVTLICAYFSLSDNRTNLSPKQLHFQIKDRNTSSFYQSSGYNSRVRTQKHITKLQFDLGFVRPALKVVTQNGGYFMHVMQSYLGDIACSQSLMQTVRRYWIIRSTGVEPSKDTANDKNKGQAETRHHCRCHKFRAN